MCDRGLNKLFRGGRIGITEDSLTYGRELVLLHPGLHPLGVHGGLEGPSIPVVWTSLGPLPRWVLGPTTRWAPGTTRLALHGT
jgi:hypothetical protein